MQCCESGMFIPDPDFYPSRIPDPKTATKERGVKKFVVHFSVVTNITKLKIILFFNWQENFICNQNVVIRLSKIYVWDPGTGFRDPGSGEYLLRIPDPGVQQALDPRSATLDHVIHVWVAGNLF
jgi:hypothetical protein